VQVLRNRSTVHRWRWSSPWLAIPVVVVLAGGGTAAYAVSHSARPGLSCASASCTTSSGTGTPGGGSAGSGGGSNHSGGGSASKGRGKTFRLSSTTPSSGATGVASNTQLTVTFNSALKPGGPTPTLSPAIAGSWRRALDRLIFTPSAPFAPFTQYTLTIPGGRTGVLAKSGAHLAATHTATFTVAAGSVLRLQQLLAELGYLPVSYTTTSPAPQDMATPQLGTFAWRWAGLPAELTGQWTPGTIGAITKGAVMMFETENGLTVDGIPGPHVWATLLNDVAIHKTNTEPVSYVVVTKALPQHLTAWVNGTLQFKDIPVNTGVPGANTTDGTFQVFEHVLYSDMKGTDVTGTKYTDPHVPWASYFDGGEALHGYPRATYGWPQSNGCVEMPISTAGRLWPYTPIGTLVSVNGPNDGGPTPTTTTTAPSQPAPAG
jgi:peptidoglycan hydrolase-like protein with peptidoglycan-binding domain